MTESQATFNYDQVFHLRVDGRVDVDIVREDPLVLVVRSKDPALVMRAAKYLAQHCGGKVLNESEEVHSPGR